METKKKNRAKLFRKNFRQRRHKGLTRNRKTGVPDVQGIEM